MNNIEFGPLLREHREKRGWTQEQLASKAELSTRYVQSLEAQDKLPSLDTVFKISNALGLSPGELLNPLWLKWEKQ